MTTLKRPAGAAKSGKRVGRGQATGSGCTSGRGNKGQKSRSGFSQQVGFEGGQMPLTRRIPKHGFKNKRFENAFQIVNIDDLKIFGAGETVDYDALLKRGMVNKKHRHVKLLGKGDLTKKLNVRVDRASKKAIDAVEKQGGTVEIIG